jgi:arsenite methyltransferase
MATDNTAQAGIAYLDMQAYVGITKHNGGRAATDDLLSLCHVQNGGEVLNVGCGIGVGAAYIAKEYGCRVVGVDVSEKMIAWSRRRARQERVEDKIEFHVADVLSLPFASDRFSAVICESVLAFVDDKRRALSECMRVTAPGGYVGLNEAFVNGEAPPEFRARAQQALGVDLPNEEVWRTLWRESGLENQTVSIHQIDPSAEIKDRMQWIGWRWTLPAFGRLLWLYLKYPGARQSLKEQFKAPVDTLQMMGYGLFSGQKTQGTRTS